MDSFQELIRQGAAQAWLFVPSAVLLGALHGLEPGHSKTVMADFIVAIRGTVMQAVLLGLAATVSHTAIVWAVALAGLYFGAGWTAEASEPYLQLASGLLMVMVALWVIMRTWRDQNQARARDHGHHHSHHHDHDHGHDHDHHHHHHDHDHDQEDSHQRAHAADIQKRFTPGRVTTGQIVVFGLTGGLIPCPAAITVLLICLQLREVTLGIALVLCFSVGLAAVMVATGAAAAVSVQHVGRRWAGFERIARRAPYFSGALIVLIGLYFAAQGLAHIV